MRASRLILQVVSLVGIAVLVGVAARVPLYFAFDFIVDKRGPSPELGAAVSTVVDALPVCAVVLVLIALPRLLARQGVEVDEHGMTVLKRPMLWSPGRTASIPWRDVHLIKKSANSRNKVMLEVLLYRVDHELRMPAWAKLVLSGETKLGSTSSRPRVLVTAHHDKVNRLDELLRSARPDLFELPDTAPEPSPSAQGSAEAQWVDLRWRQGLFFTIALAVLLFSLTMAVRGVLQGSIGLFFPLLLLGILALLVHAAPRMYTHQGVAVDSSGITLVQDSALWFGGATVHMPWPEVRAVGEGVRISKSAEGSGRTASNTVELMLRSPDWVSGEVPQWSSVAPQETQRPPASPAEPLTRITIKPGNRIQRRVVEALRAVRPDLFRA